MHDAPLLYYSEHHSAFLVNVLSRLSLLGHSKQLWLGGVYGSWDLPLGSARMGQRRRIDSFGDFGDSLYQILKRRQGVFVSLLRVGENVRETDISVPLLLVIFKIYSS